MGLTGRRKRCDQQHEILSVMRALYADLMISPQNFQICIAAVIGVRAGNDAFVILALAADERCWKKAVRSYCVLMFDSDPNRQSFRQQNLSHDAVRVPGVPAASQPLLQLGIVR